ncbi:glycosyl transferase [Patiriisocius marinistellae]|uniref:Glycosyl transferase n=2 Tax=Patiriisocius marinistellae TaxID=2494560 RepID=A0A5J4FX69_9FLAO|nr:glycosyl transferase [Patiriisocius marinistellae]
MEARNFATAREMLQDNNWLLTTLNGEPRYQKPPLPTWLTAISAGIFGLKSLFAMRLPAALITLVLVLTSYKLALKYTAHKTYSFISALILATSFYIVFSGRNGQWDIFTHGFMMVCIYQMYLFFTSEKRKYMHIIIAALFFGCSFMSKGPVSLYALLLPFLIAYGFTYKYQNFKSRIIPIVLFLVIALVLSGWWHYYTYIKDPETVLAITNKETGNWTSYNVRPFYYYWSFFTQSGIWTIPAFISLLYPYLKNRVFNKKAYLFTFLWTMASVVLLSIIPEKKSRYLLPVLIPLALNCGFYIEYLFRRFSEIRNKRETVPVYFNFGLIGLIGVVFPIIGFVFLKDANLGAKWIWFALLSITLFTLGLLIFKNLKLKKIRPVFFLTIAFIASITCFGLPLAKSTQVNPDYKAMSELREWQVENDNLPIYDLTFFTPEMIWDFGDTIPLFFDDEVNIIKNNKKFGILVAEHDEELFKETFVDGGNFRIEKITRYDMNPQPVGNRQHKTRLWRDFFVVTVTSKEIQE